MKKKSLKVRIKAWIFKKFLQRYLVSIDMRFISLFIVNEENKQDVKKIDNRADIERKRIMKVLNSKKFRDYFYMVVKYDRHTAESLIKPYGKALKDRIYSFIAKIYIQFFNKKLYEQIQRFQKIRDGLILLDGKIDEYFENTTVDERLDRAVAIGMVTLENADAQKRMRKIQSSRIAKIRGNN